MARVIGHQRLKPVVENLVLNALQKFAKHRKFSWGRLREGEELYLR